MEVQADPKTLKSLVIGDKVFRSVTNYAFTDKDSEKALTEFHETDELRKCSLQKLRDMLSKDGVKYRMEDANLLRFLRCRKFKCKEAYDRIRSLYSVRKKHLQLFCFVPSHLEDFLKDNSLVYLPYRDAEGNVLMLERLSKWNPAKYPANEGLQLVQILLDIISMSPACQLNKIIFIIDLKDTNISHFSPFLNLSFLMLAMKVIQNINPIRIKCMLLLNCHNIAATAVATCKLFMKKKLADRILILDSGLKELHRHVNPAILPKEYGGLIENECTVTVNHVMNNLPYLKYEYSFCI